MSGRRFCSRGCGILVCVLLVCTFCTTAVSAAAPAAQRREESTVYHLDAAALTALLDPAQSAHITADSAGISLAAGASEGRFVSLPIEMPEFTSLSLLSTCLNTTKELQPELAVSVYRREEQRWSDWTILSENKAAGREKSAYKTVLIRYRVSLSRPDADAQSMLLQGLTVTGGERFLTQNNLVTALIMGSALLIFLYRKKRYGAGVFRRRS